MSNLQGTLKPGMQYITSTDNTNPKSQELAFQKGDLVTILSTCQKKGWFRVCHHPTSLEGWIPASALRERPAIKVDSRLSLMPWFHGPISGVEAVQQLQSKEDGLFLVRESMRHSGDYVLCVSHQGEVVHYRIHHIENSLRLDPKQKFSNLIDLTEFYTVHQGVLCTKLLKPKPKQGTKSAEEELSKAGWLLSFHRLIFEKKIGQGEFGDVLKGEYMGQPVAIKNIKCDITAKSFLAETTIMTTLKHKNLVNLLGVVLHNGLYIVMEFMSKGNLVNYLRSRGRVSVPPQQLICFCLDVAEGMEYLEDKELVHRDLAARNILVSEQGTAKISDFGLSQSKLLQKDQSDRLPIKWTAPEALLHNKFSSQSDVWSFGIFVWEVYSYGRGPYSRMTVKEVYKRVCSGYRMEAPENCPSIINSLMRSCWEDDPGKRPSFKKLKEKLMKLKAGHQ